MKKLLRMKDLILLTCAMILLGIIHFMTKSDIVKQNNRYMMVFLLGMILLKIVVTIISSKVKLTKQGIKKSLKDNDEDKQRIEKIIVRYNEEYNKKVVGILGAICLFSIILSNQLTHALIDTLLEACKVEVDVMTGIMVTVTVIFFIAIPVFALAGVFFDRTMKKCYVREAVKTDTVDEKVIKAISILSIILVVYGIGTIYFDDMIMILLAVSDYLVDFIWNAKFYFKILSYVFFVNVVLVLGVKHYFKDNKQIKTLLTIITLNTYSYVAHCVMGMSEVTYIGHLTVRRLAAVGVIVIIALILAYLVRYIWKPQKGFIRYAIAVVTIGYLLFAGCRPDYWIAKYNVTPRDTGRDVDIYYLVNDLSLDAKPVVYEYLTNEYTGEDKEELLETYRDRIEREGDEYFENKTNLE